MEINKEELEKLSLADVIALKNYVADQKVLDPDPQGEIRYACVEEINKRINKVFTKYK